MTPTDVRRRVLFIEDEADLRSAYQRAYGARYEMAFKPDVIVLDMRLPDTDGIDLLRLIRADRPDTPVVITTAYTSIEPLVEVLGIGHSGYLIKPYTLDELAERIDAAG
jgi:DNA-binding response OmpR family regulator